jgi:deoxyribonuclease (pyrimidine dimer)
MTRINVGIFPGELSRQHLIAEHREIKRIPNSIHKAKLVFIPKQFCLGPGHVRFFYDKGKYLLNRYLDIYNECIRRGYNVQYYGSAWDNYPDHLFNDWSHTETDTELIRQRIKERTNESKNN